MNEDKNNFNTINNLPNVLDEENSVNIGKLIGKIILIAALFPVLIFFLVMLCFLLIHFIEKGLMSIPQVITGIKYTLIILSVGCLLCIAKNTRDKNNKIFSNIILSFLSIIFIAPVIYFKFFSSISLVNINENIKIRNIDIPTLYKLEEYHDSLLDFKMNVNTTYEYGQKITGECIFSFYNEEVPKNIIDLYDDKLLSLGYSLVEIDDEVKNYAKNNNNNFVAISHYGGQISYCVIDGSYESYDWD